MDPTITNREKKKKKTDIFLFFYPWCINLNYNNGNSQRFIGQKNAFLML